MNVYRGFWKLKGSYYFVWLIGLLMSYAFCGCNMGQRKKWVSPPGYNINDPIMVKLPTELDEISGLAYFQRDTCVFGVADELGYLYKVFLNRTNHIEKWYFSDIGDYEEIALLDSNFYVLSSNGDITVFRYKNSDTLQLQEYPFNLGANNEFEILYFDSYYKKLVMICKDCEIDKKKRLSTFTFDPWTQKFENSAFTIDVQRIANMVGEAKMKFKPSAAAIHPVTGDLYIVSAINKLIVIADRQGNARSVFRIDPGLFKQPEGITFAPNGAMIISNEAADVGVADLLIFPYHITQ